MIIFLLIQVFFIMLPQHCATLPTPNMSIFFKNKSRDIKHELPPVQYPPFGTLVKYSILTTLSLFTNHFLE